MTQPLYQGTGRGSGLNAEIKMGMGPGVFINKGDSLNSQFPKNAGKTLVTNVPLSNRTITTTTTVTSDLSYGYPLVSLIDNGSFVYDKLGSHTYNAGQASSRNCSDLWDNVSLRHWSTTDNLGQAFTTSSGITNFFGTNLPAVAFSGNRGYYFMDVDSALLGSDAFVNSKVASFSGLANWDLFVVANLPLPGENFRALFSTEDAAIGLSDVGYATVGWSNNRPMVATKAQGGTQNILFGGYTLLANTNYLLHLYSRNSQFGMRVNNLELTVTASGASINNGRFFQVPIDGASSVIPGELCLGGVKGKPWDCNGFVGAVKLYSQLSSANQSGVAYSIMNRFGITPLG